MTILTKDGHEDQVILTEESYKSQSISTNESTNIDDSTPSLFLQCLYKLQGAFLQYLYKAIIIISCLRCLDNSTSNIVYLLSLVHVSIQIIIRTNFLHYLYEHISTVILILVSLGTSLLDTFLQLSLLMSLGGGILQSSLLTSLRSNFVLTSQWKIFLQCLYKDIYTVMGMP